MRHHPAGVQCTLVQSYYISIQTWTHDILHNNYNVKRMTDVCGCPISRKGEFSNNKIEVDCVKIFKIRPKLTDGRIKEKTRILSTIHPCRSCFIASYKIMFQFRCFSQHLQQMLPKVECKKVLRARFQNFRHRPKWFYRFQRISSCY